MIEIFVVGLSTIIGVGLSFFVIRTSLRDKSSKYAFGGAVKAFFGRYEDAGVRYKKALEYDPNHFEALYYLAMRHADRREFPQAVSFYERCLRKRQNDPNVLFKFGAVCYDMGHEDRAVELWKKFIEKSRNEQNIKMASSLLERIGNGEKEILSDQTWLKNFEWNEEGFSASKKISIFLFACGVEFILLIYLFL